MINCEIEHNSLVWTSRCAINTLISPLNRLPRLHFCHGLFFFLFQMKNNPNQICWLVEKVPRSSNIQTGFNTFQQFLDNQQYTKRGILRYEKMFGAGYVSTGGPSTTKVRMKLPQTCFGCFLEKASTIA